MDVLYGSDQKLGDMEDSDMADFLDSDMFNSSMTPDNYMDNDWLNCFFDDPVLNDKMITDAAQPPCIKSEHSYSLNNQSPGSPLGLAKIDDIETDFMCTSNALDLSQKSCSGSDSDSSGAISVKDEPFDDDPLFTTSSSSCTMTAASVRQSTIILATTPKSTPDQPVFPQITVKQEPPDTFSSAETAIAVDQIILPPTPPSSASSDSEGSLSPQRSAPSSPVRQNTSRQTHQHISSTSSKALSQPLFVNPLPQSGLLILSEEEKRTLVSEGYPIPGKLPLTKQEEKNLKKIRRKIKNKISAQESRRKKKEYLEALEKRVESFNQENTDLRKKVDTLESNNRSLLGQLHKLQALVAKMPRPSSASATQTGTVLMVLVLCFAVFLGSWSPTSLNIGYSSGLTPVFMNKPEYIRPAPDHGPSVASAAVKDDYSTPNMKSRMLLSVKEEQDEMTDDVRSFYPWDQSWCLSEVKQEQQEYEHPVLDKPTALMADIPGPHGVDDKSEHVETTQPDYIRVPVLSMPVKSVDLENSTDDSYQAMMHPDIAVEPVQFRSMDKYSNMSAEIETA